MERSSERELSYRKKDADGKLVRSDERKAKTERSEAYIVEYGVIITKNKIARAAALGVRMSSTTSFESGLVKTIKVSTV